MEKQKIKIPVPGYGEVELELIPLCQGSGSFGTVFLGFSEAIPQKRVQIINERFAIKKMSFENTDAKESHQREIEAIRNLEPNNNVVKISKHEFKSEKNLYIFLEFCVGGTLFDYRHYFFSGRVPETADNFLVLPERMIFNLMKQLLNGLIFLHENKVVHEDIKPNNVLISGNHFKICDFGSACVLGVSKINPNERNGTIAYMPVEKLDGSPYTPNFQSDLFSMGVTIYEAVFGFRPYVHESITSYPEYLNLLRTRKLKPVHELIKNFNYKSASLERALDIINEMLEIKPKNRPTLESIKKKINEEPFKSAIEIDLTEYNVFREKRLEELINENLQNLTHSNGIQHTSMLFSPLPVNIEFENRRDDFNVLEEVPTLVEIIEFMTSLRIYLNKFLERLDYSELAEGTNYLKFKKIPLKKVAILANKLANLRLLDAFSIKFDKFMPENAKKEFANDRSFLSDNYSELRQKLEKEYGGSISDLEAHLSEFNNPFIALRKILQEIKSSLRIIRGNSKSDCISFLFLNRFDQPIDTGIKCMEFCLDLKDDSRVVFEYLMKTREFIEAQLADLKADINELNIKINETDSSNVMFNDDYSFEELVESE